MALKALMLRKKIAQLLARETELNATTEELDRREAELETSIEEAQTEEERSTVEEAVSEFESERAAHNTALAELRGQIEAAEEELRALEAVPPPAAGAAAPNSTPTAAAERTDNTMNTKRMTRAFGAMTHEERSAFVQRDDIKQFLADFRSRFAGSQTRAITGAELTIPTDVLPLIRENAAQNSKLISRVRTVPVNGRARQTIMGNIPEAIWTEACGALNELTLGISQVEVDGYKVGGYVAICNATLEDSDLDLLTEIILALGVAIGKAVDKAILFGKGVKMPLGIATRLAQASAPGDYPEKSRPWQNLSQSNVITIPTSSASGVALFQQLAMASGAASDDYASGEMFWAMSKATKMKLMVQAISFDANGAIVAGLNNTMPVVGGEIITFSSGIIPDNTIIAGYGEMYLLAERDGGSFAASDLPLFIQDQTVAKGTARYDGLPVIPEAFVAIGIGEDPTLSVDFAPDLANPAVAALASLAIGSLALDPSFVSTETEYEVETSNATNTITAVPSVGATCTIKVNGHAHQNGTAATWQTGANTVAITVKNGTLQQVYTVTVTKS